MQLNLVSPGREVYWLKVSKLERQIGGFLLEMLLAKVHLGDAGSLSVRGRRLYVRTVLYFCYKMNVELERKQSFRVVFDNLHA
jgi:hypothetical protein